MLKIGIIGPDKSLCNDALYNFGVELGQALAPTNKFIVCGGMGGFMEAVCKGVKQSEKTFRGQTIGILPEDNDNKKNKFIDVAISTGIGFARNVIIINSVDLIIAVGGGAGTLSELAFAWQKQKKVLCITLFSGWSKKLAGEQIDKRHRNLFIPVKDIQGILSHIN